MPSPVGPAELLADLAVGLDAIAARWYVFGAQAALVWGRPRLTTDVDVTVKCTVSTDQLVRALDASGFSLRLDGTEAFIRTTRVVPLEHRASGLALDVVLGPGLEDLFLERAVPIDVAGTFRVFRVLRGRSSIPRQTVGVAVERYQAGPSFVADRPPL